MNRKKCLKINKINNMFILVVLVLLLCMSSVYAIMATSLQINATAKIYTGYGISITDIKYLSSKNNGTEVYKATYDNTISTFNISLPKINSKISYEITIANIGSVDAILKSIDELINNNDSIDYKVTGIKVNNTLKAKKEAKVTVEFFYNADLTAIPIKRDLSLCLDFNFATDSVVNPPTPVNDYNVTWNKNSWGSYTYNISSTITYLGDKNVASWEVVALIPSDAELISCYGVTCEIKDNKLHFYSLDYNSKLTKNSTASFGYQLYTTNSNYDLDIESVYFRTQTDTVVDLEEIKNIKTNITAGSSWTSNNQFIKQFTITVINNTKLPITDYKIYIDASKINGIVNYWNASATLEDGYLVISGSDTNYTGIAAKSNQSIGIQLNLSENTSLAIEKTEFYTKK